MLSTMRTKMGPWIVGGIIGTIALVFIFSGVFYPKATRGLHEGSVAGTVNGDPISVSEFNQALNRQMEFFKNMGGNKLPESIMGRMREGVFEELVARKLKLHEAENMGRVASDEEVRERIQDFPVFQKDGHFDLMTYKRVLESNNYTPSSFERTMRDDISLQDWDKFFKSRVLFTGEELRREYEINNDKRNIKYVVIGPEAGRKNVKVEPAQIQKYLSEPSRLNLVKSQYEQKKNNPEFAGKTFDQVRDQIARDLLASEKVADIKKANDELADRVMALLKPTKDAKNKDDAGLNEFLKPYGLSVQFTGMVTATNRYIAGITDPKELLADAFSPQSPIDPAHGGKLKRYHPANLTVVAVVVDSQKPDATKFDAEREQLITQLKFKKERALSEDWIKRMTAKAKVTKNPDVIGAAAGGPGGGGPDEG